MNTIFRIPTILKHARTPPK